MDTVETNGGPMTGYDRYCDHVWSRDDANCEICVRCKKRREVRR
jgi:hypothetical protein